MPTARLDPVPTARLDLVPIDRRGRSRLAVLVAAGLSLLIVLSAVVAVAPGSALAATTLEARCDVNLRARPSTSAKIVRTIPDGARVTAAKWVTGSRWKARCGGALEGRRWWKVTAINGRRVSDLYGVSALYGATKLFKTVVVAVDREAACSGVALRTGAKVTSSLMGRIAEGVDVTTTATVSGGSWSATCAGDTAGSSWYRITSVDGRSVQSLYGVAYVYGARGLFRTVTEEPVATPKPSPTPTPTPKPTASPAPTPKPTPTPAPSASPAPTTSPSPTSGYTEGIDISHWQGVIDWAKVAAAGKRFAYMKASESTDYVDPTYRTNRAQAKANGLLVGAYHFARPDATAGDAIAEADHFVDTAAPQSGELIPVLDLEQTGGLDIAALKTWTRAFLGRVYERTGIRAAIYVSPSFWSNRMGNSTWFAANGYRVLWVAHWTTASQPTLPASNWGGYGWTFWQYTSSGTVPGIGGRVDLDRYRGVDFTPVLVP